MTKPSPSVSATSSPYNLQGFHSPNLMVVVTEAHAVPGTDIDALRRLNPARTLMTGNPLVSAGPFYDSHHSKRDMYDTVRIGAGDTPNVTRLPVPGMVAPEHVADRKAEWGRNDPMYVGGVLGRFPDKPRRRRRHPPRRDRRSREKPPARGGHRRRMRRIPLRTGEDRRRQAAGPGRQDRLEGARARHS